MKGIKQILSEYIDTKISRMVGTLAKVLEVNDDVCDCEPLEGGATIEDAMLTLEEPNKANYYKPKIGSIVLINYISEEKPYVSMFSELESIELQGNTYSVSKWETLQTELEKERDRTDAIIEAIENAVTVPNDGGASLKSTIVAAIAPIKEIKADYVNVPNENLKHG